MVLPMKQHIRRHINSAAILQQLLEWGRDQIQNAVDAKQVLIEELEHNPFMQANTVVLQLLKDEQLVNLEFMNNLNTAIDLLQHHINIKRNLLEEMEQDSDYDTEDEDDD